MPVGGAKPKPEGEAVTRNRPVFDWTEVENVPFEDGPRCPQYRPNGTRWPAYVLRKWSVWRRMPHARLWTDADWQFVFDTLEIAARFCETNNPQIAAELRQRERWLGTTMDARRDIRIRYVEPKKPELAVVTQADDYRDL
jgi:hypothetical protein